LNAIRRGLILASAPMARNLVMRAIAIADGDYPAVRKLKHAISDYRARCAIRWIVNTESGRS
jgi:hypothetical protein